MLYYKQNFSGRSWEGVIENHIEEYNPAQTVKTRELLNNVSILYMSNDKTNLVIAEALYIHQFKLNINAQSEFCHGRYICSRIPFIEFLIVEAILGYVGFGSG